MLSSERVVAANAEKVIGRAILCFQFRVSRERREESERLSVKCFSIKFRLSVSVVILHKLKVILSYTYMINMSPILN